MNKLKTGISHVLNFISVWPAFVGTLVMALIIVVNVLSRFFLNYPFGSTEECSGYLNVILVMLPLSYVLRRGDHLRVDLVMNALPPGIKSFLGWGNLVLSLIIVIILLMGTAQLAVTSLIKGTRSFSSLEAPVGPIQIIMPIGLLLFAIQIIVKMVERVKQAEKLENA